MAETIPQFGVKPADDWEGRSSAYAVVSNENNRILALVVHDVYHLPGGGIGQAEEPQQTVVREALEEAGCRIEDLTYIGKANQYFPEQGTNKLGIFYKAKLVSSHPQLAQEADHIPMWITHAEFINSNASEFQKWAVDLTIKNKGTS